jgi:alkylation response protein AidB-like acyl-CoA dehydrogenase
MRFALSDEQSAFCDAVRRVLADTCPPDAVRAAWGGAVGEHAVGSGGDGRVRPAWSALADVGALGVMVPEAHGGLGLGDEDMVPLLVECGRAALPDPVSSTAYVAAGLLRDHLPAAAPAWLPRIATGEATVLVGFEGSPNLPAARSADAFLLCEGDEVHLLRPGDVRLQPLESVDGARALCRVEWDPAPQGVELDGEAGVVAINRAFDRAALGAAALLVGLAERMLDMTVGYVGERRQFGVPVGSFQAVQHHLADASMAVAFTRPLLLRAAHSLAHDDEQAPVHVSMAKARASEAARRAGEAALQCHGAIGYTVEYDLHLFLKRAWALSYRYGDAEFHRRRVRAALLGR